MTCVGRENALRIQHLERLLSVDELDELRAVVRLLAHHGVRCHGGTEHVAPRRDGALFELVDALLECLDLLLRPLLFGLFERRRGRLELGVRQRVARIIEVDRGAEPRRTKRVVRLLRALLPIEAVDDLRALARGLLRRAGPVRVGLRFPACGITAAVRLVEALDAQRELRSGALRARDAGAGGRNQGRVLGRERRVCHLQVEAAREGAAGLARAHHRAVQAHHEVERCLAFGRREALRKARELDGRREKDPPLFERLLLLVEEGRQKQPLHDVAHRPVDARGDRRLVEAERPILRVHGALLHRREVLPLEVLFGLEVERLRVGELADDRRDRRLSRRDGGLPPALAEHELEEGQALAERVLDAPAGPERAHHHGLEDAALTHAREQLGVGVAVRHVEGARRDLRDEDLMHDGPLARRIVGAVVFVDHRRLGDGGACDVERAIARGALLRGLAFGCFLGDGAHASGLLHRSGTPRRGAIRVGLGRRRDSVGGSLLCGVRRCFVLPRERRRLLRDIGMLRKEQALDVRQAFVRLLAEHPDLDAVVMDAARITGERRRIFAVVVAAEARRRRAARVAARVAAVALATRGRRSRRVPLAAALPVAAAHDAGLFARAVKVAGPGSDGDVRGVKPPRDDGRRGRGAPRRATGRGRASCAGRAAPRTMSSSAFQATRSVVARVIARCTDSAVGRTPRPNSR